MKDNNTGFYTAILYGMINTLMVIPISISFCAIIFRDAAFIAYMPQLVKLVLFSSAIHQISFAVLSSLPFAVGQVQDAGLIFLSAMAANIVQGCQASHIEASIMPTTLFTLAICTSLLGIMLVVVAKLKLATLVQYLPMPVIGGYLAFIGFFCGEAGLAMMGDVQISGLGDWRHLLDPHVAMLITPGVVLGLSQYALLRNIKSPFVLPLSMLSILVGFYSFMWLFDLSFEEVREAGWVAPLAAVGKLVNA
jgi:SulP family sulfate permease